MSAGVEIKNFVLVTCVMSALLFSEVRVKVLALVDARLQLGRGPSVLPS